MFQVCTAALLVGCMQLLSALTPIPQVPFTQSMQHHGNYDQPFQEHAPEWQRYSWLYNGYERSPFTITGLYRIPRKIHFIWLDGPLPNGNHLRIKSWKKFHPQWKVKVWTQSDIASFKFRNKKAFENAQSPAEKANIWSYEILYAFGGVYAKTDFECLRAFDVLHQSCGFYTGIASANSPAQVCSDLIGCKPHHRVIESCINMAGPNTNMTGSELFTYCFNRRAQLSYRNIVAFPLTFFYPVPAEVREDNVKPGALKKWIAPETFAVQH